MRYKVTLPIVGEKDKVECVVYVHELPPFLKKGRTVPVVRRG